MVEINNGTAHGEQSVSEGFAFRAKSVFAFVGNSFEFPNYNLDVLRGEHSDMLVVRCATLREIGELTRDGAAHLLLLVVAQSRAMDLLDRFEEYRKVSGGSRIALAYTDTSVASKIRASRLGHDVAYLPMRCSIDAWAAFVRLILCDQEAVPEEVLRPRSIEVTSAANCAKTSPSPLSERERQIVGLVARGLQNRSIGDHLNLSEHTVKLHLHHAFSKLGVKNRAGAAAWYLSENGHAG